MLLDPSGDLYVTEYAGNRIRRITPAGVVSTFAGALTPGATDGTGTGASFYQPTGLCRDGSGNLYVADSRNYAIRRITPGGVVTTVTGGVASFADGSLAAARFGYVYDVKLGPAGELYVTDLGNYRIRVICP
ncbi:NHL repeat protein [compost metagenome]